jgi:hypothetical protein
LTAAARGRDGEVHGRDEGTALSGPNKGTSEAPDRNVRSGHSSS